MDRRNFLCRVTSAGAAASIATATASAKGSTVTYDIKGFTCITCAVGLEVMLRGLKGITQAHASYPAKNVVIEFDEKVIARKTIVEFIKICGFSAAQTASAK